MAGVSDLRFNFSRVDPVSGFALPVSEKTKDEELHHARKTIEQLQQRTAILEKMNVDAERRLQDQSKQCLAAEKRCDDIRAEADHRAALLHKEIERLHLQYEEERLRSERFREQLSRTEREMYGILQRRYEGLRGPNMRRGLAPNVGNTNSGSAVSNTANSGNTRSNNGHRSNNSNSSSSSSNAKGSTGDANSAGGDGMLTTSNSSMKGTSGTEVRTASNSKESSRTRERKVIGSLSQFLGF